jgi:hypothetical protein
MGRGTYDLHGPLLLDYGLKLKDRNITHVQRLTKYLPSVRLYHVWPRELGHGSLQCAGTEYAHQGNSSGTLSICSCASFDSGHCSLRRLQTQVARAEEASTS